MFRRRTIVIVLFVVLVVAAGLVVAARQPARAVASAIGQTPAAPEAAAPGAPAHTLQVLGTFVVPNQAVLMFKGSGRITEIRVTEGMAVKKGDALAVIDSTELQLTVQQAQAALAGAQARLNQVRAPATDSDAAAAQAAVDAALKNYNKVRTGPTANDIAPLRAQINNAKAALDQAQSAYDRAGGATNPYSGMLPQSLQLQTATNNYDAALAAYNNALTHPTAAELAAAWGQVEQAQAVLARLQPLSDNIAVAQAAVDQAQAALALARQQVTNATLTAPFDGTVVTIVPHIGEMAGPATPVLTLADLTHLQLQGALDQSVLEQVQIGQTVTMTPDAFKDKTVTGKVSKIGWTAMVTGGVTSVLVTVDVDQNNVPLRPGLTASAQIETGN
ncbi:MAG: efflux RND transporter periplasmic adaptor subunit [Anaerolineae bacterium]